MISQEKIKSLYETELKPQLADMEKMRKFVKRWRRLAIGSGIVAILFLSNCSSAVEIIGGIVFIAGAIYGGIKAYGTYTKYKKQFKNEVVRKVIYLINPAYEYSPDKHINSSDYNKAGIFKQKAERYSGDDLIIGKIDKTPFKFSEFKTEYKTTSTDSDGNRETKWHTIFRGLFFLADFNKNIEGQTFVFPEKDRKLTNLFGKEKAESKHYGELVKLENPEFEEIFSVYGSSQQEARYILTPVLMEAMVNIYKTYGLTMYFSFKGANVFCAIPFNRNLFEPNIKKSGVNYSDVEEMYVLFSLIETIVNELNLNTRIWTKD
ncbi:Protein of unknown function [Saccharicrinis carchari]|uniref:Galanin n=1 Tax=Saccharicrinis carchari TaxID=1168039 RepID=A0A521EB47_SACCC|nr:DUF3137 domain-containing protein [Saccharicrinis carchari]SMO80380.1 Protein of unknown function [Saccharicrinis carchari]